MFTLGVDFGTNSVRALVVRCSDGAEYGSRVVDYPSGAQGVLLDPKDGLLARQHPRDYLFGLEESIKGRARGGRDANRISTGRRSSASASTRPGQARSRLTTRISRWRRAPSGRTTSTRNAGCGKITPVGARRPRSPNSAPSFALSTSRNAAGSIPRNGFGPSSGTA